MAKYKVFRESAYGKFEDVGWAETDGPIDPISIVRDYADQSIKYGGRNLIRMRVVDEDGKEEEYVIHGVVDFEVEKVALSDKPLPAAAADDSSSQNKLLDWLCFWRR